MAYSTPATKAVGDTITAAEWNQYIRDNMELGFPAIIDAKADIPIGTGANAGKALTIGSDWYILEAQSAVSDGIRWTNTAPGAELTRSTAISISTGSDTQVTGFDATPHDFGTFVSGDTFVIPTGMNGFYLLYGGGYFTGHATSGRLRQIGLDISGSVYWQSTAQDGQTSDMWCNITMGIYIAAAATIKLRVLQNSGTSINFNYARMSVLKVR